MKTSLPRLAAVAAMAVLPFSTVSLRAQIFQMPGGNTYELVTVPSAIDWDTANTLANASSYQGVAGHLAVLNTAAKDAFVSGYVATAVPGSELWAGGYQTGEQSLTDPQAGWTWVAGGGAFPGINGQAGYANWFSGEPNDFYGPGSEQHLGINFNGVWNDEASNLGGYVVEYGSVAVPEPAETAALTGLVLAGVALWHRRSRARA